MSVVDKNLTRDDRSNLLSEEPVDSLIKLSNLEYSLPRPLTLVTTRRMIEHVSTAQNVGPNSSFSTYLNVGDDFVNPMGSYALVQVRYAADDVGLIHHASGSAINLFRNSSLYHSSGTQFVTQINNNMHKRTKTYYKNSVDYLNSSGRNMGFASPTESKGYFTPIGGGGVNDNRPGYAQTRDVEYAQPDVANGVGFPNADEDADNIVFWTIPMSELCDVFNTKTLIPSYHLSGSRLYLETDSAANALQSDQGGTDFEIQRFTVVLDSFTLSDEAISTLQDISASRGLSLVYSTYHNISAPVPTTSLSLSMNKAVSQAQSVVWAIRDRDRINAQEEDSLRPSLASAIVSYQGQLGSVYYPQRESNIKEEHYQQALLAWNAMKGSAVNKARYFAGEGGIVKHVLERDHMLNLSGRSVSGSRSFQINATLNADTYHVDAFLEYTKISRAFLFDRVLNLE